MSEWMWWLSAISLATFIVSLLALPWLVAQIPADYFCHDRREAREWNNFSPLIHMLMIGGKNLLGLILLTGGLIMLFIPGQGILTMAMGLLLMDYPGKYRLERRIVAVPAILRSLNWLRAKRRAPPLKTGGVRS